MDLADALRNVRELLQEGDATAAMVWVQRMLAADAGNALALNYQRQVESDPMVMLGRESCAYTVKAGESLSTIARDRLRDSNLFYVLARYNHIKVPKLLAAGQVIRVPGRCAAPAPPPAAAAPAPAPAMSATPAPPATPPATSPAPPPAAAPAASPGPERITALMREGRTLAARQDLCNAVRAYDKVLEIDPAHGSARTERQRALDLIERLRKQGSKLDC